MNLPSNNVHSADLLVRASRLQAELEPAPQTMPSTLEVCELAVEIQKSLRAANCDSSRINSDPAMRLVMAEIGQRCKVDEFSEYDKHVAANSKGLEDAGPLGKRSRNAKMAQDGAANMTPLANTMLAAAQQVTLEGGAIEHDAAVFLIAHQMSHLAQTYGATRGSDKVNQLVSWCDAQRARLAVDAMQDPKQCSLPQP